MKRPALLYNSFRMKNPSTRIILWTRKFIAYLVSFVNDNQQYAPAGSYLSTRTDHLLFLAFYKHTEPQNGTETYIGPVKAYSEREDRKSIMSLVIWREQSDKRGRRQKLYKQRSAHCVRELR